MENFYNTYIRAYETNPINIVEIGSRDGNDAELLRMLAGLPPQAVHIFEAHPDCAKDIRQRYPDINLYHLAVFDKMGIMDFNAIDYNEDKSYVGTSSLLKRDIGLVPDWFVDLVRSQENRFVKVVGITGQMALQLMNQREIDMMKIDVEGATYEVLNSFGVDIRLIKMMHLETEVSPMWVGQHLNDDVEKLLEYYGFAKIFQGQAYPQQIDTIWKRTD